jgi:acyl-CoA synthetase (NDP forming)
VGAVDGSEVEFAIRNDDSPLSGLLSPKSVAVLGASDRQGNLGGAAIRSMIRFRYGGQIYPVNPKQLEVSGRQCYPSVSSLPSSPDLAILAVSAESLLSSIEECVAAGIQNGIAWAGGFAEIGQEGAALQKKLSKLCRRTGFRLCGPNCLGIINTSLGFTGTFTSSILGVETFRPSSLAIVSQSGGIAGQAMGLANRAGFGFNYLVSCGNEAVLSAADFIQALVLDDSISAIAVYLESVLDGDSFIAALREAASRSKPVVILKGGASEASSRATLAHTGRLGGSDRAFDAVMREFGAIRVYSLEELVDTVLLIETTKASFPRGSRVAVTTFGGGAGVLAVDQCIASGLEMAALSEKTAHTMAALMTPLASLANPIDMTPQSMNDHELRASLPKALATLAQADSVDSVLFLCASNSDKEEEMVEIITSLRDSTAKPVVVSWSLASGNAESILAQNGIYSFPETARATRALGNLVRRGLYLTQNIIRAQGLPSLPLDWGLTYRSEKRPLVVSEHEVADILKQAGLAVASGLLIREPQDLEAAVAVVPWPWAMKGISSTITHRASAGLIALNVASRADASKIFEEFRRKAMSRNAYMEGIYIAEMVKSGHEILVSAVAEPVFGTMVVIGAGGNLTELIDDVLMARAPVSEETALRMLGLLRTVKAQGDGFSSSALRHAAAYISQFSRMVASAPLGRFTFELNPVKCGEERAVAVDGLLIVESNEPSHGQ